MPELLIRGVPVDFPFEPYDVQTAYMEKVIESLQKGVNGLLESPTGTGKTLSLLCASLGWLLHERSRQEDDSEASPSKLGKSNGRPTKIIYASRTHTQLTQAISELKRTSYGQKVKNAVIGSRDQLCIQDAVLNEKNNDRKADICNRLKSGLGVPKHESDDGKQPKGPMECKYYKKVQSCHNNKEFTEAGILDIEDIVKAGRKLECCPYYTAFLLQERADIIFMPYNYIFFPSIRRAMNLQLQNTIIILDEAHNINKICEEAASFCFRTSLVTKCVEEVAFAEQIMQLEPSDSSALKLVEAYKTDDLKALKDIFLNLEKVMKDIKGLQVGGAELPQKFVLELMEKAEISASNGWSIADMINNIGSFLNLRTYFLPTEKKKIHCHGAKLKKMSNLLKRIFDSDNQDDDKSCYKVYATREEKKKNKNETTLNAASAQKEYEAVINYWCFSAAVNMKQLQNQRPLSILLTSGTLGPLPALALELGIDFPVTLENGHVVNKEQVYVSVVSTGPDGTILNSSFENRTDKDYIQSLGLTIQNFSRIVPDGILVFFPSYTVLKLCKEQWQEENNPIWPGIAKEKEVFVESQDKRTFTASMKDYYAQIKKEDPKGACFIAVCRGKVSEGLDFSDKFGRAVIVTGLPYPPLKEPKVRLKKKYLDENRKKHPEGLSGQMWYRLEATRAVNQAIGRVIRHRNDYGAILLCDSRYAQHDVRHQLSAWLQPFIQTNDFGKANKEVIGFLRKASALLSPDKTQSKMWVESPSSFSFSPLRLTTPGSASSKNVGTFPSLQAEKRLRGEPGTSTAQPVPENDQEASSSTKQLAARRKLDLSPIKPVSGDILDAEVVPIDLQEQQINYLEQVKSCLPSEGYEQLMKAIETYSKGEDFKVLFRVLYNVLGSQSGLKHLIAGFDVLLHPEDKEKFKRGCAALF